MAIRLCFFGDSFVNGLGDPDGLGWAGRLCAAEIQAGSRDLTCYNLGIRRETSRELRARWREEAARRLPDWMEGRLVFSFGANDATVEDGRVRVPAGETRTNCRAILGEARRLCPILMVGPPPLPDPAHDAHLSALSAELAVVCTDLGVSYLDVWRPLTASGRFAREAAAGDGAHPGAEGYTEFAALVRAWPAWRAWFLPNRKLQ